MTKPRAEALPDAITVPPLPEWAMSASAQGVEDAAFFAGAAMAHLHHLITLPAVPQALWRERLALSAAEVCVALAGRRDGASALRDALHLTRAGDHPGPGGVVLRQWVRVVARPVSVGVLSHALEGVTPDRIALCLDARGATPVDRAAAVIDAILTDTPRAELAALVLADAVLSMAMGRSHLLPILSVGIKPRDLRLRGDDLRLACHRAVTAGVARAVPLAADLARRAVRLQAAAPKLRAKAAGRAVQMFLTHDALPPAALTPLMSDRAARRLCERLVELGAVRELTGRDTFRLYGL